MASIAHRKKYEPKKRKYRTRANWIQHTKACTENAIKASKKQQLTRRYQSQKQQSREVAFILEHCIETGKPQKALGQVLAHSKGNERKIKPTKWTWGVFGAQHTYSISEEKKTQLGRMKIHFNGQFEREKKNNSTKEILKKVHTRIGARDSEKSKENTI